MAGQAYPPAPGPRRGRDGEGVGNEAALPTQSMTRAAPPDSWPLSEDQDAGRPAHGPAQLARFGHRRRSQARGQALLMGVLGDRDDAGDVVAKAGQGGDRAQPQRARAYDHRRQFFAGAGRPGAGAVEGGVDGAGHGFDEHGRLVGQALRHVVELALVGGEGEGPAPAGVVAVAGLQAGRHVAARQVDAVAPPAVGYRPGTSGLCPGPRSRAPVL